MPLFIMSNTRQLLLFKDPINAKLVHRNSFRSSKSSQSAEQVKSPTPAPKPAPRPKPTPKPVVEVEQTPVETTGSTQVKRGVAIAPKVSENEAPTEQVTLTTTATMLDQVAGKLSSLKHDDEDDVFAQGMWIYLFLFRSVSSAET